MSNQMLTKSYLAEGAIPPFRAVKWGAADGGILAAAGATDKVIGVTDSNPGASGGSWASGERVDVHRMGIVDVEYGGNVTRGDLLVSDSVGRAVTAAPAAGTNNQIIGRAEVSGVLGDIGSVMLATVSTQG